MSLLPSLTSYQQSPFLLNLPFTQLFSVLFWSKSWILPFIRQGLTNPGWPWTWNPPVLGSQVLESHVCTSMPGYQWFFKKKSVCGTGHCYTAEAEQVYTLAEAWPGTLLNWVVEECEGSHTDTALEFISKTRKQEWFFDTDVVGPGDLLFPIDILYLFKKFI